LAVGCGLPAVLLLVIVVLLLAYTSRSGQTIDSELERIRTAGQPVTAEELDRFYTVPPGKTDITPTLLEVFALLEKSAAAGSALPIVGTNDVKVPPPGEPWEQQAAVAAFLQQNKEALDLLHEAAHENTAVRFPVNFAAGVNALLPHVQKLRQPIRLLALEAEWKAHHGDADGAADSLHAILCLGDALEQEPLVVSQQVRMVFCYMGREGIRKLTPWVEFSDADLARFQADLRRPQFQTSLQRALVGERVVAGQAFREMPLWRITFAEDYAAYLEISGRLQNSLDRPWPRPLRELDQVKAEMGPNTGNRLSNLKHALTKQVVPSFWAMIEGGARHTAQNAAADAALAAERFRRAEGHLPETLEQLVPRFLPHLPPDPYTGAAQRMIHAEDGVLIYSVGLDGVDNGGQGDDTGKPDVVFELKLPKQP
jgi:hypothetical protein